MVKVPLLGIDNILKEEKQDHYRRPMNLEKFHKQQNSLVTVTAVRPPARFGALKIEGNKV